MLGAGVLFLLVLAVRSRPQLAAMLRDHGTVARLAVFGGWGCSCARSRTPCVIGYTNAGTATVLQSTGIAFVMLFSCVFARRLPRGREFVGLVAAMAATWLIATQGDPGVLSCRLPGFSGASRTGCRWRSTSCTRSACSRAGAASP